MGRLNNPPLEMPKILYKTVKSSHLHPDMINTFFTVVNSSWGLCDVIMNNLFCNSENIIRHLGSAILDLSNFYFFLIKRGIIRVKGPECMKLLLN